MALEAGTEAGITRADNLAAFAEIKFAPPRLADLPAGRDGRDVGHRAVLDRRLQDLVDSGTVERGHQRTSSRSHGPPGWRTVSPRSHQTRVARVTSGRRG